MDCQRIIKESFQQISKNLDTRNKLLDGQEMPKYYFDKGSKELKPLSKGDHVFLFKPESRPWESIKIISNADNHILIKFWNLMEI